MFRVYYYTKYGCSKKLFYLPKIPASLPKTPLHGVSSLSYLSSGGWVVWKIVLILKEQVKDINCILIKETLRAVYMMFPLPDFL